MQAPSLDWEDPLEEEMATHSSILSWRIAWTEEPGGFLQSIGLQRIRQDRATEHALIQGTLLPGCPWIPKFKDAQVFFRKWHNVCI